MKILFTIKFVDQPSAQILSNQRWFGNEQPLITEMSNEHLQNARVWLYGKINSLRILGYNMPVKNGFDYSQWLVILKDEENRRLAVIEQAQFEKIEALRIATLSTATRKRKAAQLLENPTDENIAKAEKLLQIKSVKEEKV